MARYVRLFVFWFVFAIGAAHADPVWRVTNSKVPLPSSDGASRGSAVTDAAQIEIDFSIFDLNPGDPVEASMPGGSIAAGRVIATELGDNGSPTLRADMGQGAELLLVGSGHGWAWGRLETPEGAWRIATASDGATYLSPEPPPPASLANDTVDLVADDGASSAPSAWFTRIPTTGPIDVMIIYTPRVATLHGANLAARLDAYMAAFNQALSRSGAPLTARLVHAQQVNYVDGHNKLSDILTDLGAGAVNSRGDFSGIAALRASKGADLVYFITPRPEAGGNDVCGVAHRTRPGAANNYATGYDTLWDSTTDYCGPSVMVHELGHNLGQCHDRDEACSAGSNNVWGRGHFTALMRTQMTYNGGPAFYNIYSTPSATCGQEACGSSPGNPDEADTSTDLKIFMSAYARTQPAAPAVPAAMTPAARAAVVGETVSVFGVILNPTDGVLKNCAPMLTGLAPDDVAIIRTDPATNAPAPNLPGKAALGPGELATFRFDIRARSPGTLRSVLRASCSDAIAGPLAIDLNTVTLSIGATDQPDVVMSAATASGDGIVTLPADNKAAHGVFVVAARNLGAAGSISLAPATGAPGVAATLCLLNSESACLAAPQPSLMVDMAHDDVRLIAAFVDAPALPEEFDPLTARISVRAKVPDGALVGAASVAIRGGK